MASLDEFNPGRWEAEDEDFLDREDNYVLQKSTNTLVTNVTAKTRRRRSNPQRINGAGTNKSPSTMNRQASGRRQPPSFASPSSRPARRGSSHKSHRKQASAAASRPSPHATHANGGTTHSSAPSSRQHPTRAGALKKEKTAPVVPKSAVSSGESYRTKASAPAAPPPHNKHRLPGILGLASVSEGDDASQSDEDSLDIVDVFPALDESPKPPDPNDRHYKSQHIYIPVRQEKWNEASVMRLHQSMMPGPPRHYAVESQHMKDAPPGQFDEDDDKSLKIEDVFPVLATSTGNNKANANNKTLPTKKPIQKSALLEAAQKAQRSKERIVQLQRQHKQKTAAAKATTTAATMLQPRASESPHQVATPTPTVPTTVPGSTKPIPVAATGTTTVQRPPQAQPSTNVAPMYNGQEKGHASEDTAASSNNDAKQNGYQLPTYVQKSSEEHFHASDELTMDSALLHSNGSNQNIKDLEKQRQQQLQQQRQQYQQQKQQKRQQHDEYHQHQPRDPVNTAAVATIRSASDEEAAALRAERKRAKKHKTSKSHKKHKKKKSKRRLQEAKDREHEQHHHHVRSDSNGRTAELQRQGDSNLGPESMMEREEAEAAARRERRRLKRERKEKKRHKKRKHKTATTQSERHLPTQPKVEPTRLSTSLPEIEESVHAPDGARNNAGKRNGRESAGKTSTSRKSSRRSLQSTSSSRSSGDRKGSRRSLQSASSGRSSGAGSNPAGPKTKLEGASPRGRTLRPRNDNEDDDNGGLGAYLQGDDRDAAVATSDGQRRRSSSHTTVKKSNVVPKTESSDLRQTDSLPRLQQEMQYPMSSMRSVAAGMLDVSDGSFSPGTAAAARARIRMAREESRRAANPDLAGRSGRNSALHPVMTLEKNVSSTLRPSSTSLSSPSSVDPLQSNASAIRQQKQGTSKPLSSKFPAVSSTRPSLMDNERMNSVGNFDMVSAVDAAVAAKKQGTAVNKLPEKKKKKSVFKRVFGRKKKSNAATADRSAPVETQSADTVIHNKDQEELNEYLSSSKSSWYENSAEEKKEHSVPSSPVVELPREGTFKYALGTPPGEKLRTSRLDE